MTKSDLFRASLDDVFVVAVASTAITSIGVDDESVRSDSVDHWY
jgi:hypothetical protein